MYQLSRTVPVNEPKKSFLSRHDVWNGLLMKANNALPYVPEMKKCDVVEQGDCWLVRDIMLKDIPLREKVTFEPEQRVIFDRTKGSELGRIENIIGEDANGNLTLTFAFSLRKDGVPEGSDAEKQHFAPMEQAYLNAVASTLAAVRRTVDEKGREHLPPKTSDRHRGQHQMDLRLLPRRRCDGHGTDACAAHRRHDADLCEPSDRARQGRL